MENYNKEDFDASIALFKSLKSNESSKITEIIELNKDMIAKFINLCNIQQVNVYNGQKRDYYAKVLFDIILPYLENMCHIVAIEEDGNCLFRSVSVSLFGDQSFHIQLRLASIHYLIKYRSYFTLLIQTSHAIYKKNSNDQYSSLIEYLAKIDNWGDDICMVLLSMVINRPIICIQNYKRKNETFAKSNIFYVCKDQLNKQPVLLFLNNKHFRACLNNEKEFTPFIETEDLYSFCKLNNYK